MLITYFNIDNYRFEYGKQKNLEEIINLPALLLLVSNFFFIVPTLFFGPFVFSSFASLGGIPNLGN